MALFLLVRTPYAEDGLFFGALEGRGLCDWMRRAWAGSDELGVDAAYGLSGLFDHARDEGVPAPAEDAAMLAHLRAHLYSEGTVEVQPHLLHVQTDDGEREIEYWLFEPERVDALPAPAYFEPDPEWFEAHGDPELGACAAAYAEFFASPPPG